MQDEENEEKIIEETVDDVVFEQTEDGEGESYSKDKIKKMREELKEAKEKSAEYLTLLQRERADFVNYKKDEDTRKIHLIEVARESIILDLLPVLDSYDMAFSNKEAWEKVDKNWRMGVEYIHQQILKVLADYGVTEISPNEGEQFDPHFHQPIESIKSDEKEKDNTIEKLIQKGYKNSKQTLRPARVNVYTNN